MALHFVGLLLLPVLSVTAVALVLRALLGRRARRHAEAARARIEEAPREEPGVVMLRGRLVLDGPGLEGQAEGVAAETRWLSKSRMGMSEPWPEGAQRAEGLAIDTGDEVVLLRAAVRVAAGSQMRLTKRVLSARGGHAAVVPAILRQGDRVVALGTLGEEAQGSADGSYRQGAVQRTLEPPPGEAAVVVAATAQPAVSVAWRYLRRQPAVLLTALVFCVPTLSAAYDITGLQCDSCSDDGDCHITPRWRYDPDLGRWSRRLLTGSHFRCDASGDDDCRASKVCRDYGSCSAVDGTCKAKEVADCAHTDLCLRGGYCTPVDGFCRVARDEDCLHTDHCRSYGHCVATDKGCRALSDEHCRRSPRCLQLGLCFAGDGDCVAKRDEDCAATRACDSDGVCSAVDGRCVATTDDCRTSRDCDGYGRCTAKFSSCAVTGEDDCLRSEHCAANRYCLFVPARPACEPDAATCRDSAACRIHGRCGGHRACAAESDRDCQGSRQCQDHGACSAISGVCVKTCADHPWCRDRGMCSRDGDRCVAASDADCAKSSICKLRGLCHASEGRCVASAAGCEASRFCRRQGYCSVSGDGADRVCARTSDADCDKTIGCAVAGTCSLVDRRCAIAKDSDCERTAACKELGNCHAADGACVVSEAGCRASEVCARHGWCTVVRHQSDFQKDVTVCFTHPPTATGG